MECPHVSAPSDEELLKVALDEATLPREASIHLSQCAICQQRLKDYQRANSKLITALYRSRCPDSMQISSYCAGLLSSEQQRRIAGHLLTCPLCAEEVSDTRRFLEETSPEPTPEYPLWETAYRIVATLAEPKKQLVVRADRGETAVISWPRHYRADPVDLLLQLSHSSDNKPILLGILTSVDPEQSIEMFEGSSVELRPIAGWKAGATQQTEVDDLGNIFFPAVPIGVYDLTIHLPDFEIVVQGLTIENSAPG